MIDLNITSIELKKRVDLARSIIGAAGDQIKDSFHQEMKLEEKTANDFVTELDKSIEFLAQKKILHEFKEDSFYGEEGTPVKGRSEYEWVIDPIDGTNNFVRGWPMCGVQIAILLDNEPVYALISRPLTQETYEAVKGYGSWYKNGYTGNKKRLFVSTKNLEQSIGVFDTKVGKTSNPSTLIFSKLVDDIATVRVFGVAVFDLPSVAEGSAEFLVTGMANKYDIAAGKLLIEEAGGSAYTVDGSAVSLESTVVIFSCMSVKGSIVDALA